MQKLLFGFGIGILPDPVDYGLTTQIRPRKEDKEGEYTTKCVNRHWFYSLLTFSWMMPKKDWNKNSYVNQRNKPQLFLGQSLILTAPYPTVIRRKRIMEHFHNTKKFMTTTKEMNRSRPTLTDPEALKQLPPLLIHSALFPSQWRDPVTRIRSHQETSKGWSQKSRT